MVKRAQGWRIRNGLKASKHRNGWRKSNPSMFLKEVIPDLDRSYRRSSLHA